MSLLGSLGLVLEQLRSLPGGKRSGFRSPVLFPLHLRQAGVSQPVKKKKITDRTNHTTLEAAIANNVARGLLSESMIVQNKAKKSFRPIY